MGYGAISVFTATMASGGTLSNGFDLGRSWNRVYLRVPTMNSGADIFIQGSADNSSFSRIVEVGQKTLSFSVSIASSVTLTGAIDLGESATNVYGLIPSLNTGTSILVHGSLDNSTFRRITLPVQQTATVQAVTDFAIATFAANTSRMVPLPSGFRYIKLELATGVTDVTNTFKVLATVPNAEFDFNIPSSVTSRMVPIPNTFRYIKVETDVSVQNGNTFKVICSD